MAKFGIPRTLKRAASWGYLSVSTFKTIAFPLMSAAVRETSGAAILHGPHHSAQKSTRTGTLAFPMMSSNESESASNGSSTGSIGALHAPQRPRSARCATGIRFLRPQDLQVLSTAIATSDDISYRTVTNDVKQVAAWKTRDYP
jgi:hypothetical protein